MKAPFRLRINSNALLTIPRHQARRSPNKPCSSFTLSPEVLKSQDNRDNIHQRRRSHAARFSSSIGRHCHDCSGWNRVRCKHCSTLVFMGRRRAVRNNVRDLRSRNSRDSLHRFIHFVDCKKRSCRLRPTTTRIETRKPEARKTSREVESVQGGARFFAILSVIIQ